MKKIVFLFLFSFIHLHSQDNTLKVLFDLTTDRVDQLEQKLISGTVAHKNYFESQLKELEVAVIIHGNAYKFFLKNLDNSPYQEDTGLRKNYKKLQTRLESLYNNYDVHFLMCDAGRKNKKIAKENVDSFVRLVPSAGIVLIEKQNEGYAYFPIH